jgi:hypothetical protein
MWGGSVASSASMDWPTPAEGADAELLALGREFDALHPEWVSAAVASREAEESANRLYDDLVQRKGWTPREGLDASLAQPGVHEAIDAGDAMDFRIEKLMASIRAIPAHTLDGLAVKARAVIPGIWSEGQYEENAGLGDFEDWKELNARSVIDECLSFAATDWKGKRWRAPPVLQTEPTAKASADAVDLSVLGITDLFIFYEKLGAARALWSGAMCEPLAEVEGVPGDFVRHTPYGERASYEDSRAGLLMDRIAAEVASRTPANKREHDTLLALRIQHEIACEGRILDAALLSDIAKVWG